MRRFFWAGGAGILVAAGALVYAFAVPQKATMPGTVPETVVVSSTSRTETVVELPEDTPSSTRLLFVGDIMLDRNVAKRIRDSKDPGYVFRKLPEKWFDSFDYAVANLEGPVTDRRRPPEKSIDFQFDPSVITTLKEQGIDAFSQANNHALDQGSIGYADSVRRLREAGFLVFGHQVQDDEIALATTTVKGIRFAFLGYNTTDNPLVRDDAQKVIESVRPSVDHIIVYMHWGQEYKDRPEASTKELAHWFIDHGVDVVIGGHPHWVQGVETYKRKPIVYSLGNFIFDQYFSKETQEGLAVELVFEKDGIIVKPIPIRLDASQPKLVEGDELKTRLEALANISDFK
ncbi:CapA family protein [Candidatus Uhrbacteria bacterium]|nr:CapA family protein [Candidatus Uhrbacteria bacterium]